MDELELFGRTLKLEDGEVYSLKQCKNPYWRKIKMTLCKDGYYYFKFNIWYWRYGYKN